VAAAAHVHAPATPATISSIHAAHASFAIAALEVDAHACSLRPRRHSQLKMRELLLPHLAPIKRSRLHLLLPP